MPTSKVHPARSVVPGATASKSTTVSAKKPAAAKARAESPSGLIDAKIDGLGEWRGEMLSRLRALIKQADP